jgi:hypothetical protein
MVDLWGAVNRLKPTQGVGKAVLHVWGSYDENASRKDFISMDRSEGMRLKAYVCQKESIWGGASEGVHLKGMHNKE